LSQFEFSIVLVSIVIAIAISEVLATWGRMIRYRNRIRPYWVHVGWMALVLLFAVQSWWGLWALREWPSWSFFEYVMFLVPYLTLVVLTFLVCPDMAAEGHRELESYFYENAPWFFALTAGFLLEIVLINTTLRGDAWVSRANGIRLAAVAAVLPLGRTRSRGIHAAALIACSALLIAFILLDDRG